MKKLFIFLIPVLLFSCQEKRPEINDLAKYVDPFIGTGGHGHTYPGASLPFGMVQLSPDTRLTGWDGCSAYHYSDSIVYGFSHTHLSGTGVSDYGDVLLMPTTGIVKIKNGAESGTDHGYSSYFKHENEIAEPGYYKTILDSYNINVELTSTKRVGIHKYTYPKNAEYKNIILDLEHRDMVLSSSIKKVNDYQIEGYRVSKAWAQEQHIYFVAQFSEKIKDLDIYKNDSLQNLSNVTGKNLKAAIQFQNKSNDVVYVKVAISAVDIDGARKNLKKEAKGWNFDNFKEDARYEWNKELNKMIVNGNETQNKIFYTSLYHSYLNPNLFMDVDGRYRGMDLKVHQNNDFTNYTIFSLWDTYRATHPLFTLTQVERTKDFLKTFTKQYEHGGKLPIWELAGNYTGCMIGYHSIPVITDAYFKGIEGPDYKLLYEAMLKSAMDNKLGLEELREYGYIPADLEHESVSKTLEYAYDDWCIAQFAKKLGKNKDYITFIERAQYYKNIFDPETGFMTPKMNSNWTPTFDPREVNFHFTEANSWQYSFYVPQDIETLIQMNGGDDLFIKKLDQLFTENSETTGRNQADITGLIGQYAHGNEPSHHMAYLYAYAGMPWKTQEKVKQILNEMYSDQPDGLCGNEDCGQMSSWYNLSSIGIYPVNPADGIYVFGSPIFSESVLNMENGNSFVFKATNISDKNIYIKEIKLNGKAYDKSWITHKDIVKGGEIEFIMDSKPNKEFGFEKKSRPSSIIEEHVITSVPVIKSKSRTFYDYARIEMQSVQPDVKIFYTIDGTEPTEESLLYNKPFYIYNTAVINAIAVSPDGVKSKTVKADYKKIPKGRSVKLFSEYSNQYSAGGENAIIDYLRGPNDFRTGYWQGYQGQDFEAIINLGRTQKITKLSAGFIQEIRSWIWLPPKVEFFVSTDGFNFKSVGIIECDVPDNDYEQQTKEYKVNVPENLYGRYVKVIANYYGKIPDWHLGAGHEAWIFIDEVTIE